jgi:hypothetical protein
MVVLTNNHVSPSVYNNLPHIKDVQDVPVTDSSDLADLRVLLTKHQVPPVISIRLIHKHYDVNDGEVMAFEGVTVPDHGTVKVMHPINTRTKSPLHGVHFFVDDHGALQAYEYSSLPTPDVSSYEAFLHDFCQLVVERGLQMKYGLKLQQQPETVGWMEFEYPDRRSTVMIPEGAPRPQGDLAFQVTTEWGGDGNPFGMPACDCGHTKVTCHHSTKNHEEVDLEFYLGPQKIEPGNPVWAIMNAVAEVC